MTNDVRDAMNGLVNKYLSEGQWGHEPMTRELLEDGFKMAIDYQKRLAETAGLGFDEIDSDKTGCSICLEDAFALGLDHNNDAEVERIMKVCERQHDRTAAGYEHLIEGYRIKTEEKIRLCNELKIALCQSEKERDEALATVERLLKELK